jgi:hypothetical protein
VEAKDEARIKSWILLLAGLAGIGYQQWTGESNLFLLLVFTVMTGVPGLSEFLLLLRNSPTVLQSSSSRQQLSQQESDTVSTKLSEDEV